MWLVRLGLKRPYTFIVMAMLIVIVGVFTIFRMPTDIFPDIDIPVISIIWNYGGLPAEDMEKRIVNNYERFLTTVVSDIDHVESQSLTGIAVIKVYLQPGASIDAAIAQIASSAQAALRAAPPGATAPFLIQYSASNVPIIQIALQSDSLSEQQLFDYGINFIRPDLATIRGAQIPYPYGGKTRQIMVDIDPKRLFAYQLSPRDVDNALNAENVILPSGTAKMGANEYPIVMNSNAEALDEIAGMPIRSVGGKTIYIRDVANVRDGYAPQTSMVHVEGKRSVLMSILKQSNASTLDVTSRVKTILPSTQEKLPKELKVQSLFDQSLFVRAAVSGVVKEAAIAAGLTALMILLFLGSWRSTFIVVISIPLSILVSIEILALCKQTLNVMTLGGMSLAVGILVDDATVEIENIHRQMGKKKPLVRAILDGAQEIAIPAFVSTLCICIVFLPVIFITGAAKSLFVPLAMAVVFAMLTSYVLSRTLVPTLVRKLLHAEVDEIAKGTEHSGKGLASRFFSAFNRGFDRTRQRYGALLAWALAHRPSFIASFLLFAIGSAGLYPLVGRDFFPSVDAGLIKLHVRGAPGTRIEETEKHFSEVERTIREVIPKDETASLIDTIGIPPSGINLSLSEGALVSSADGQISIALKEDHQPTAEYRKKLRDKLNATYPGTTFFFLAPDISNQVLNFGLAAPIDVQVVGPIGAEAATLAFTQQIAERIKNVPGAVDVHLAQVNERPQLKINVDRTMAQLAGISEQSVASDVLVSLSSSGQVAPSYWLDKRGVQYLVAVQTPQAEMADLNALKNTPISTGASTVPALLSNLATVSRSSGPVNITHYNVARTFDVQANVEGSDLGTVVSAVHKVIDDLKANTPRGTRVELKGQAESMDSSFKGLALGLLFAVVLVYFLMVVNFQSWLDPFIILTALPGAIAGIAWMLFLTHTTVSVPALMGAIMCVGVATSNSILVVTFANEQRSAGRNAHDAALAAGMTRLRPVIMTALAMIIGMLPMSLGLGEGGEQNAPLGRAVIGGLLVATVATLFFVPVMYSILRKKDLVRDLETEGL